jgi:hypothetical protein
MAPRVIISIHIFFFVRTPRWLPVFLDDEQMQQANAANVLDDEVYAQPPMHLPLGLVLLDLLAPGGGILRPARSFCEESEEREGGGCTACTDSPGRWRWRWMGCGKGGVHGPPLLPPPRHRR